MKKIYWVIGGVVLIGATVGIILVVNKSKKDKAELEKKKLLEDELQKITEENKSKGSEPIADNTIVETTIVNVEVPPPSIPQNEKVNSFNKAVEFFGKNADNYGTYILYNTTQKKLGLGSGTAKVIVKLAQSGDFGVWLREINADNRLAKGNYYNGGTKIVIYDGKNKGLNITGANPINNIARSIS